MRKIALCLAAAAISTGASAKTDRAAEIVDAVQLCKSGLSSSQIAEGLMRAKWRDTTPVLAGRSMAQVTGSAQYSRGRDQALVSGQGSMVGQNCQFDFAKVKPDVEAAIVTKMDSLLGAHINQANGLKAWSSGSDSYSLSRRYDDTLTLLWLPAEKQEG